MIGELTIIGFALLCMVIFRSGSLFSGWKWMLCTVSGLYAAVFTAVPAVGLVRDFLPEGLWPYAAALLMLMVFMITLILLDIAIDKLTPGSESYHFPSRAGKVLAALCRGAAGIAVAVMILQTAAVLPADVVPGGEEIMRSGQRWMVRIAGVVNRCAGQDISSGEVESYLDGLKYTVPETDDGEKKDSALPAGEKVPQQPVSGGQNE